MNKDVMGVERIIRPEICSMKAYHVPSSAGMIKLDAMENPYGIPKELNHAWLDRLQAVQINRYPDPSPAHLKKRLLDLEGLADPVDVIFGNGSDEIIQFIIQALAPGQGPVLTISPTFVMYGVISKIMGKAFVQVPLKQDFSLDSDAVLKVIEDKQPSCVFLSYPNNPTGNLFNPDDIKAIVEHAPGLVVIDEAYLPFAGRTLAGWLENQPDLLVMRTLSKAGFAGLRFGMLFGNQAWLAEFDKIRLPYNINSLTCASVGFALDNYACFEQQARLIVEQREAVYNQLVDLDGINPYSSDANFILFRPAKVDAGRVFQGLLEKNILIKNLHNADARLDNCLRVTIGTPQENNQFIEALEKTLQELT